MPTEARPAATVIIARDWEDEMQVCMLQRSASSEFLANAYVFPGGRVDAKDSSQILYKSSKLSPAQADKILKTDNSLSYFIAAIRESFEEAGILFADAPDTDLTSGSAYDALQADRLKLNTQEMSFEEFVLKYNLSLLTDHLYYFAHWITPLEVPKRYDTRFFVAKLPENQLVIHDNKEISDSIWISPKTALKQAQQGSIQLIFPTIKNLEKLCQFSNADELILYCQSNTDIPTIMPTIELTENGPVPVINIIN